jgi:hypothetical protein
LLTSRPNALVIATALARLALLAVAIRQLVGTTTTTIVVVLVITNLITVAALLPAMPTLMVVAAGTMSAIVAMVVLQAVVHRHVVRMMDMARLVAAMRIRMQLEGMIAAMNLMVMVLTMLGRRMEAHHPLAAARHHHQATILVLVTGMRIHFLTSETPLSRGIFTPRWF